MDFNALKAPFDPSLISWRVGATDKKKQEREKNDRNAKPTCGIALAYIDARDVMDRFDEVCGVGGWQIKYSHANGKTIADIGVKVGDEWIWKANGAGDTQVEAEKGAISDAMKRAAVVWGVGRYLYDVDYVWADLDNWGRIKNPNDPRLKGALAKAAQGIRVTENQTGIGITKSADDVEDPSAWFEERMSNLQAFVVESKAPTQKNFEARVNKIETDPIYAELDVAQYGVFQTLKEKLQTKLNERLKEKEAA